MQTDTEVRRITAAEWRRKHRDFKGGTMRDQPRVLSAEPEGTCLVAVVVVHDVTGRPITSRVWGQA